MKQLLLFAGLITVPFISISQESCNNRTFISNISLNSAGFTVLSYSSDLLDSLHWNFGDGTIISQTDPGSGSSSHTYANPGTYTVMLEQWGHELVPDNPTPFHCSYSADVVIYNDFQDSICGGDFLIEINGNVVTFSNTSSIQSPSFSSTPDHPLWEFGNGSGANYLNRLYDVYFDDGTYTACLYYSGYSFNNGGYMFGCETCKEFTIGGATASVAENVKNPVRLYPNPSAGAVVIESTEELNALMVTDLSGKICDVEWSQEGNKYLLATETLHQGTYLVRCSGQSGETIVKLTKL